MKKLIVFCLLFGISFYLGKVHSQETKFITGGTLGFRSTRHDPKIYSFSSDVGYSSALLSTSPFFGYSFGGKQIAGLALDYQLNYTNLRGNGYDKSIRHDFLFSPFLRYYFKSYFFTQLQLNFGKSVEKIDGVSFYYIGSPGFQTDNAKYKYKVFGYGFGAGFTIGLGDNVSFEPLIRYVINNYSGNVRNTDYKDSGFIINTGFIYRF